MSERGIKPPIEDKKLYKLKPGEQVISTVEGAPRRRPVSRKDPEIIELRIVANQAAGQIMHGQTDGQPTLVPTELHGRYADVRVTRQKSPVTGRNKTGMTLIGRPV